MSEFNPVLTLDDLDTIDPDDEANGYRSGIDGAKEPGSDKSRSFWHGWCNGRAFYGISPYKEQMENLAKKIAHRINNEN